MARGDPGDNGVIVLLPVIMDSRREIGCATIPCPILEDHCALQTKFLCCQLLVMVHLRKRELKLATTVIAQDNPKVRLPHHLQHHCLKVQKNSTSHCQYSRLSIF